FAQSIGTWMSRIKSEAVYRNTTVIFSLVVILICFGWSASIANFKNTIKWTEYGLSENSRLMNRALALEGKYQKPVYFLPSWILVNQVNPLTIENTTTLMNTLAQSDQLMKQLSSTQQLS